MQPTQNYSNTFQDLRLLHLLVALLSIISVTRLPTAGWLAAGCCRLQAGHHSVHTACHAGILQEVDRLEWTKHPRICKTEAMHLQGSCHWGGCRWETFTYRGWGYPTARRDTSKNCSCQHGSDALRQPRRWKPCGALARDAWVVNNILEISRQIYPGIQAASILANPFTCLADLDMSIEAERSNQAGPSWHKAVSGHGYTSCRILLVFVKPTCHVFRNLISNPTFFQI